MKGNPRKGAKDHFYRKAKKLNLRSRAAFKLKQLSDRYDLIRPGDFVVDLGAAPGGWLQVARELVGTEGFVVGVDLEEIEKLEGKSVVTIQGDITESETLKLLHTKLPGPADVVLSDASPDITGNWDVDQARSHELASAALVIGKGILRTGGRTLIKIFQGDFFDRFVKEAEKSFKFVKASKPEASRKGSAEIYVVGKGFSQD